MSVLFLHLFLFSCMSFGHLLCSDISSGEEYDVIVLGTGYKESVLSGMMSVSGKKVLTMDRNNYYGGESASLSPLDELFERFDQGTPGGSYGQYRDWNVDLIPKLIMGSGKFVKLLIHTGVTRYMEFKSVEDSYVYMGKDHKIHKIPDNQKEDLSSSWMGQSEKTRFQNLLMFIQGVDINDESTYNNFMEDINKPENNKANPLSLEQVTTKQMFDQFGIDENTQDVVGHAIALYRSEMYKDSPMLDIIGRVKLYYDSLSKYSKSPYLYPLYGLGELPQGFARLSAIYGGTYLLDKPGFTFMYGDNGKVIAVESNGEVYNTKMVICDPSYAPDNVNKVGEVVRAICILHHPLPNLPSDTKSCQIIIPQNQVNRKHDIYVSVVSYAYNVASKGFYLATVSTQVETSNPEQELQPGLDLLGPIFKKFVRTTDLYEPKEDSENSQVFISKSYDATSNFETTCDDILELFEKATGESFDFSKVKHIED